MEGNYVNLTTNVVCFITKMNIARLVINYEPNNEIHSAEENKNKSY